MEGLQNYNIFAELIDHFELIRKVFKFYKRSNKKNMKFNDTTF